MFRSIFNLLAKASYVFGVVFTLLWIVGQWRIFNVQIGGRADHQQMIVYASVGGGQNSFCVGGMVEKFSDVKIAVEEEPERWQHLCNSYLRSAPTSDPGEMVWMCRPVFTRHGLDGLLQRYEHFTAQYWARGWWGWTVTPYWSLIASCCVLPLVQFLMTLKTRQRAAAGLCPVCGYDLRASTGRCPECGAPILIQPSALIPVSPRTE